MIHEDETPEANDRDTDDGRAIDERTLTELLADLRFLAQENGRLRAERDALRSERDRLTNWLESDRELTHRMLAALENEIRLLRGEPEPTPRTPAPPAPRVELPADGAGPRRTGIGRRFRERTSNSTD